MPSGRPRKTSAPVTISSSGMATLSLPKRTVPANTRKYVNKRVKDIALVRGIASVAINTKLSTVNNITPWDFDYVGPGPQLTHVQQIQTTNLPLIYQIQNQLPNNPSTPCLRGDKVNVLKYMLKGTIFCPWDGSQALPNQKGLKVRLIVVRTQRAGINGSNLLIENNHPQLNLAPPPPYEPVPWYNKSYATLAKEFNINVANLCFFLNQDEIREKKEVALQIASYKIIDEAKQYLESIDADDTNASVRKKCELSQFATYIAKVKNRKEFDLNYKDQANDQLQVMPKLEIILNNK